MEALEELDSASKASKNVKERNRIQVIRLLTKGFSHLQVSEITQLKQPTITDLVTRYNKSGINALKLKPVPKNNHKLTDSQKDEIKDILKDKDNTPELLGLGKGLRFWSVPLLKLLIRNKFGMVYKSDRSYHKLLEYCGFSFHKPQKVNKNIDPKKVNEFVINGKKRLDGTYRRITLSW